MKNIKTYKEFNEGKISNFVDKAKKSWKKFNAMPDDEIAEKIFGLVNIITDAMITQPKQINELYNSTLPENQREAIEKRDLKK